LRAGEGRPLDLIASLAPGSELRVVRRLLADTADAVYVPGGSTAAGEAPDAFRIGRTEVTNAQYARFVEAGGYHNAGLWPDTMLVGGRRLPRATVLRRFVDRTGVPGPEGWSGGAFGAGRGEHPVTGVAWYEAAAYASWVGGRLPTIAEWYRAALEDPTVPFPWGADAATAEERANFSLAGTEPVGTHPLSVSPFGVHDMAGNVREWIADAGPSPATRVAVGGSWQEPAYGFDASARESMDPASRTAALGFRVAFSDRTSGGSR
jgi:formylglycine-generating enzyme required for sulfatase activity